MARFTNSMGVRNIVMRPVVKCICTIGQTLCTYQFQIEFGASKVIPDYLEVQDFISVMENQEYTMEAAAAHVADYLYSEYCPDWVEVQVACEDARHFPVTLSVTRVSNTMEV